MLLAASVEQSRGWGGPVALVVAYLTFRVGQFVAVRRGWIKIENHSPTPALPMAERVKVQSTVGFTTNEPSEPDEPESGWWGEIREVGGVRFRQAQQIWRTGSHELPEPDEELEEDPDIDLALDDESEPNSNEEGGETAEDYIIRAKAEKATHTKIVQALMNDYEVSKSTAKRWIRETSTKRGN